MKVVYVTSVLTFVLILADLNISTKVPSGNKQCSKESFLQCFGNNSSIFFGKTKRVPTEADLKNICRSLEKHQNCIGKFMTYCPNHVETMWLATFAGISYICNEDLRDVSAMFKCSMSDKANLKKCIHITLKDTSHMLTQQHRQMTDEQKKMLCPMLDDQEDCMSQVEQHDCGKKSAKLFDGFYSTIKMVIQDSIGCGNRIAIDPVPETTNECDGVDKKVQTCLAGFINSDNGMSTLTKFDVKSLDNLCKGYDVSFQCIQKYEKCIVDVSPMYSSMQKAIALLCDSPRKVVVAHMNCLRNHASDVDECFQSKMTAAAQHLASSGAVSEKILACKNMVSFESCIEQVDDKDCGGGAHTFYRNFFPAMNKHMCKYPDADMPSEVDTCDASTIYTCLKDVIEGDDLKQFQLMDRTQLDSFCSAMEKSMICLSKVKPSCAKDIETVISSKLATIEFICNTPRDKVLRHMNCITTHKTDLNTCVNNLFATASKHLTDDHSRFEVKQVCKEYKCMEKCVEKIDDQECGGGAHEFYQELFKRMYSKSCPESDDVLDSHNDEHRRMPSTCNAKVIESCMKNYAAGDIFKNLRNINSRTLDTFCNGMKQTYTCMSRALHHCDYQVKKALYSKMRAIGILCNEPRQEILKHMKCLNGHRSDVDTCIYKLMSKASKHLTHDHRHFNSKHVCRDYKTIEMCVEKVEKDVCGDNPHKFYQRFFAEMSGDVCKDDTETKAWITECFEGWRHGHKHHKAIIGGAIGGFVLVLIVIVTVCICRRKSRTGKKTFNEKVNQMPANMVYILEQEEKKANEAGVKHIA